MKFAAAFDNVFIRLQPEGRTTESGIKLIEKASGNGVRLGQVIVSGPGYYPERRLPESGALGERSVPSERFIRNETRAGDVVLVHALAGQDFSLDSTVPRHNKSSAFEELFGERGDYRIIREAEALALVRDCPDPDSDEDIREGRAVLVNSVS